MVKETADKNKFFCNKDCSIEGLYRLYKMALRYRAVK